MKEYKLPLSFSEMTVRLEHIGEDILITVQGGEKPHIGCAVLSVPRPSLTGSGETSCTSSVLNLPGHKDEALCRLLAEKAAITYGKTCVCLGGFHVDGMRPEQIAEVVNAVEQLKL